MDFEGNQQTKLVTFITFYSVLIFEY